MAGLLIFPRGEGMQGAMDVEVVGPQDVPIVVGAYEEAGGALVRIALPMPDGRWLTGLVSLRLFLTAAEAFVLAHGDPRPGAKES